MRKDLAKRFIPKPLWIRLAILRRSWISRDDAMIPPREVFSRIYARNLWGPGGSSGGGTRTSEIAEPYVCAVASWADANNADRLVAVDLGCGDFLVGSRLRGKFRRYIGTDIVPELIERHRSNEEFRDVEFRCVDGIDDEIPDGDVIIIRQVLQHLSNEQILKIVPKLRNFRFAIVTEHVPAEGQVTEQNADKTHGGGIRLKKGSGVYLEEAPFFLNPESSEMILEVPGGENPMKDGVIRTTVYRLLGGKSDLSN